MFMKFVDAVVAGWDGTLDTTYTFFNRELTHTNDISFRFLTPLSDTILFRTETDNKDDYIQAELEGGKVKVTIKVDGITKVRHDTNTLTSQVRHDTNTLTSQERHDTNTLTSQVRHDTNTFYFMLFDRLLKFL